jgi:hypothetical protein
MEYKNIDIWRHKMRKIFIVIFILIFTGLCFGDKFPIPEDLPYGIDAMGEPKAPKQISKIGPNGYFTVEWWDSNGNMHTGKLRPSSDPRGTDYKEDLCACGDLVNSDIVLLRLRITIKLLKGLYRFWGIPLPVS